jgi:tetratricopeptide (TPR) repeat protein
LGIIRQLLAETRDSSSTEDQDDREQWLMVDASRDGGPLSQQSSFGCKAGLDHTPTVESETSFPIQDDSNVAVMDEATASLPFRSVALVSQPSQFNDKYKNMQTLFDLTRHYYNYRLQDYSSYFKGNDGGIDASKLLHNDNFDTLVQTKQFWTNIKNVFYFLKMDHQDIWKLELAEATGMIPVLCERQPLTLLKDMYGTLSPKATNIRSSVRFDILRSFKNCAELKLGPVHIFTKICCILCRDDGDDELSMTMLQVMLDETKRILPELDPEIFELQRTLIRLFRRNQEYQKAEDLFWASVQTTQYLHGPTHLNSRLLWTEYLYIRLDQGRYSEALDIALQILQHGQRNPGEQTPNIRSIYAMEDIAALYEKLGRLDDAIVWLRRALSDAISIHINSRSTSHIFGKLQALEDKRYQEAVQNRQSRCL